MCSGRHCSQLFTQRRTRASSRNVLKEENLSSHLLLFYVCLHDTEVVAILLLCLLCLQPGRSPSKRGVGIQFGPNVTEEFLNRNGLGESSLSGFEWSYAAQDLPSSLSLLLSLSLSLPHSLPPSLSPSLTLSLPRSLPPSLSPSLTLSFSLPTPISLLLRITNPKS